MSQKSQSQNLRRARFWRALFCAHARILSVTFQIRSWMQSAMKCVRAFVHRENMRKKYTKNKM